MGYSYSRGLLCCDICGKTGGVKKYRCPFGYCQAVAACPTCRKNHTKTFGKAFHREMGCERRHQEFRQHEQERDDMIAAGGAVRCSALSGPDEMVHVLFRTKTGTVGYYMSHHTYDAIDLFTNSTPDDYRKHGPIREAPAEYFNGTTTKEVTVEEILS